MAMKKFALVKLFEKNKPENLKHIVEIIKAAGLDETIEVVRHAITLDAEQIKAAPKFDNEPKIEEGSRIFPMFVTTRDIDRDGEIVMPRGINLKDWLKTGIIIKGHDYSSLPVGKAVWVGVSDYGIKMHIEAAPTADGDEVLALAKFMPLTASIGFADIEYVRKESPDFEKLLRKMLAEWQELTAKTAEKLFGIITKCTLLEVSIVSVPANASAVQTQLAKSALSGDALTDAEKQIVRKVFALPDDAAPGEGEQTDKRDEQIKALEVEIVALKKQVSELSAEKADLSARIKAICDSRRVERVADIEVVKGKATGHSQIEVVGKAVDIEAIVKRTLDLKRGMI